MNRLVILSGVALLLASLSGPASAEMYRWEDEHGNVHFSDSPPAGGIEAERVKPRPSAGHGSWTPEPRRRAAALAPATDGGTYRDQIAGAGFEVPIPSRWVRMHDADLAELAAASPPAGNVEYRAGFHPAGRFDFAPPYLVVTIEHGKTPYETLRAIQRSAHTARGQGAAQEAFERQAEKASLATAPRVEGMRFDEKRNLLWTDATIEDLSIVGATFYGEHGNIAIVGFAWKDEAATYDGFYRNVIRNTTISPELASTT